VIDESDDGYIGFYLICSMPEDKDVFVADFTFTLQRNNGDYYCSLDFHPQNSMWNVAFNRFTGERSVWVKGNANLIKRDEVMDSASQLLRQGTLTFVVRMELYPDYYCHAETQECSLSDDMLNLFLEENSEDVAFKVKGEIVTAHRTVLRAHAKELAELCEAFSLSKPMQIDDVKPDIFRLMAGFVYGEVIPPEIWKEQVQYITDPTKQNQSILFAASKYGFTALKSKAEAWCVKFIEFDAQNVINHLLYADANSLSLLKDAAMNFITENSKDVIASESFALLSESTVLMTEVMKALSNVIESSKRKRDE
jgi:hypothetical protein